MAALAGGATVAGTTLVGCTSGAAGAPTGDIKPTGPNLDKVPPSDVSFSLIPSGQVNRAVDDLDAIAHDLLGRTKVPGMAIAVVHDDKVVYAKGFGVRTVGSPLKVNADTIFQLASVSKSLASTVVAGVVGDKVTWDDPVTKYLPTFSLANPYVTQNVTIADMFSHRSGLPNHAGDWLEDIGYSRDQILARLPYFPLAPFRGSYFYTNFGFTAGAVAAAAAMGSSWEDLSQSVLYTPLGMTSTSSKFADYQGSPNHTSGHVMEKGAWVAKYKRDADAQSPAGGASSSVNDMAKWLRLQLGEGRFEGKQVIPSASLLETHIPHFTSSPASTFVGRSGSYGLGFNVNVDPSARLQLSHSGAFDLGAATTATFVPAMSLGIITLTNAAPIGLPESVNLTFFDLATAGRVTRDWYKALAPQFAALSQNHSELAGKTPPSNPAPALAVSAYAGTYASQPYGTATVENGASPSGLVLVLGPAPQNLPLTHWDGNTFSAVPTGESSTGIAAVTFEVGPTGQATEVNLEFLNGETPITANLGTFAKI
jgi:CubicO group peptidase (beta-lactamase class C family)